MNVLNAFAKGLKLVFGFLSPFVGGVERIVPGSSGTISNIVAIIGTVERTAETLGQNNKSGAQKLDAALPLVADIIRHSELVAGRDVMDESGFLAGVRQIVSGFVAVLNALKHQA